MENGHNPLIYALWKHGSIGNSAQKSYILI